LKKTDAKKKKMKNPIKKLTGQNLKKRGITKKNTFFSMGLLFSSRDLRKKMPIRKKNVQKNRKIVKNLLMYDKKNFFPHTHKKKSPKKSSPTYKKKRKKELKITH